MDRKEAILRIKDHMEHHGIGKYPHLKLKEALDMAIVALSQPNEPLTIEQLRGMDGRPAYWPDAESWGIISVDDAGRWEGIPFFRGRKNGVNFEYDIVSRGMEVYAYPPAHIDREKWEPCEYCQRRTSPDEVSMLTTDENGSETGMFVFNGILASNTDGLQMRQIYFCPICGRPLTEEAWADLERRVFG